MHKAIAFLLAAAVGLTGCRTTGAQAGKPAGPESAEIERKYDLLKRDSIEKIEKEKKAALDKLAKEKAAKAPAKERPSGDVWAAIEKLAAAIEKLQAQVNELRGRAKEPAPKERGKVDHDREARLKDLTERADALRAARRKASTDRQYAELSEELEQVERAIRELRGGK